MTGIYKKPVLTPIYAHFYDLIVLGILKSQIIDKVRGQESLSMTNFTVPAI